MSDNFKVKIGKLDFSVEFLDTKSMDSWNEDNYTVGVERFSKQILYVRDGLSEVQEKITVLHEIIHAIFDYYGIDHSEQLVQTLAVAFYDLIKDNDDLIRYLNVSKYKISLREIIAEMSKGKE